MRDGDIKVRHTCSFGYLHKILIKYAAMIAKDFIITKHFRTYTIIILRREETLHDHPRQQHVNSATQSNPLIAATRGGCSLNPYELAAC